MRLSARNVLKGKVKSVNHGAVNSEIVVGLQGGDEVVSVITKASAESLGYHRRQGRLRGHQGHQRHGGRRLSW